MRNYFYEHQKDIRGSNFFTPVDLREDQPFYFSTAESPIVHAIHTYPVVPQQRSASQSIRNEMWRVEVEGYTEAGIDNETVGDGGFLLADFSSSFAQEVNETSTVSSSFSSSNFQSRNLIEFDQNITVEGTLQQTTTVEVGHTHDQSPFTEWDKDTFITLGSTNRLTVVLSSRVIEDFIRIEDSTYSVATRVVDDNPALTTSFANATVFDVSYQNLYYKLAYYIVNRAERQTTVEWRDFSVVGSRHTETTVAWPIKNFLRSPQKIPFGTTAEQTAVIFYPWSSRENLTVLTVVDETRTTTTTSFVSNETFSSTTINGSTNERITFSTYWTAVDSVTFINGSGGLSTVLLRVPLVSYTTFLSYEEIVPPGISGVTENTTGTRSESITVDGFVLSTYPESIYQQRLLIHSHNGAFHLKHLPIVGYAPFGHSFTDTSPIYKSLTTSLVSTLQGSSFKGYFPYWAQIIPQVTQFVTNTYGSHEIWVAVTEDSTIQTTTSSNTTFSTRITSFTNGEFILTTVNSTGTSQVFTTVSSFETTYLDTIFYKTDKLFLDSGLFTALRIDQRNATRRQIFSIKLGEAEYGSARISMVAGGGIGVFEGVNSFVAGGIHHYMRVLKIEKPITVYLNWGNWRQIINEVETTNYSSAELTTSQIRLLRGEFFGYQSSFAHDDFQEVIYTHLEQFRKEIINESYLDFALENYLLTENQSKSLCNLTSSPLHPDRGRNSNSSTIFDQAVSQI